MSLSPVRWDYAVEPKEPYQAELLDVLRTPKTGETRPFSAG